MQNINQKAFTLLEILLVIALIAILAGIVIVAINPAKQTADARNTQRISDINTILNAIYQYSIDNNGDMPDGIPTGTECPGIGSSEICQYDASCGNYVDLSILATNQKYLVSIPIDPQNLSTNGTGYNMVKTVNNRIIVCAPLAEREAVIEVSK